MTTPADPDGTDLTALKGRRKAARPRTRQQTAPTTDVELPPLPDAHESMTAALRRPAGLPALHPLERGRLVVVETGGHVPAANLVGDYVVAEFDASEQHTPRGCRTPISRVLWSRGQHVRRDVYNTYLAQHPELAPADAAEDDPDAENGTERQDLDGPDGAGETGEPAGAEVADGVATTAPPAAV